LVKSSIRQMTPLPEFHNALPSPSNYPIRKLQLRQRCPHWRIVRHIP
jgi:hypothetical protein